MSKQIAIIGNGKLGKEIVQGLINYAGYKKENIFVVKRDYFNPQNPDARNLEINSPDLKDYKHIILAVRPVDAVNLLVDLRGRINPDAKIISFVTGLNITIISRIIKISEESVVKATVNVNIAYGYGIICYRAIKEDQVSLMKKIFPQLKHQVMLDVSTGDIEKYIVLCASMAAFDSQYIKLRYEIEGGDKSFGVFLRQLKSRQGLIEKYLTAKKEATLKIFGSGFHQTARLSFDSTYYTLCLSIGMDDGCDKLEDYIKIVATPGGCTERGLTLCNSLEDILSVEKLSKAFDAMYKKVKSMKRKINNDFNEWRRKNNSDNLSGQSIKPYALPLWQ